MKLKNKTSIIILNNQRRLTNRETEYLSLAAMGFKNREIANILFVSISTVKKAFEIIFRKLSAKDRAHAVTIAFIHKLLNAHILTNVSEKYKLKTTYLAKLHI